MQIPLYTRKDVLPQYKYCCGFPQDKLTDQYFVKMEDPTGYFGLYGDPFKIVFKDYDNDRKYYFPIIVSFEHSLEIIKDITFPDIVTQDILNNRCKILVINPFEGWSWDFWIQIRDIIIQNNNWLTPDKFVFSCANLHPIDNIKTVYYSFWERQTRYENLPFLQEKAHVEKIGPKVKRLHKFICLNRRPHAGRIALVTELFKYRKQGMLSLGRNGQMPKGYYDQQEEIFKDAYPVTFEKYIDQNVRSSVPLRINDGRNPEIENPVHDWATEKFYDSYLHICPETYQYWSNNRTFFSEKIFKPIMFLQPFVIIGEPYSLKSLKNIGYKTFNKWIDESYDEIKDNNARLNAAVKSSIDFFTKTDDELIEIISDMSHVLSHNSSMLVYRSLMNDINLKTSLWNILND